jgi:type I restriction enzyme S subunit
VRRTSASRHRSGDGWLGEIPNHWEVKPFRYIFSESHETNGDTPVGQMLSVSGYRGVEIKRYSSEALVRPDEMLQNYRVVRSGQLVVNTMWLNYAGLGVSEYTGHVSPAYRAYEISPDVNGRYIHHLLRSNAYVEGYTAHLHGIRPNSLQMDRDTLMGWPILLPPPAEQKAIADYLDRETAQIDTLIAKQEQLIATLRERRIAVIWRGALSGFNPLSDSRGSGPSLGTVFSVTLGKMLDAKKEPKPMDVSLPYIRAANLQDDGLDLRDVNHMWYSPAEISRLDIRANDLLVVEGGAVGTAVLVKEPMPGWSFQKTINRVRATSGWSTAWLSYVLRAYRDGGVIDLICDGSTIAHLTAEKLRALRIPATHPEDQAHAVAALDVATARIDSLITKAERFIELSKERRAALITAAVTGQLQIPA